nr:hypothetical protein BaRGS_005037 [Batillaria attramentaria]
MDYDVTVDLETGAVEPGGLAEGVEWQVPLSTPSSKSKSNSKCRRQGVLKLTFDGDDLECVDIHLKFENAQRWPFHIRDSLAFEPKGVTDTQDNVVEVTTWNKDISVYRRNSRGVWQLQANATNFLQGTVKMIVANNKFYASNGAKNFSVKRSRMKISITTWVLSGSKGNHGNIVVVVIIIIIMSSFTVICTLLKVVLVFLVVIDRHRHLVVEVISVPLLLMIVIFIFVVVIVDHRVVHTITIIIIIIIIIIIGGGLPEGIEWYQTLTRPATTNATCKCSLQGSLKLTFNNDTRQCADLHMLFEDSYKYSFGFSDHRPTGRLTRKKIVALQKTISGVRSSNKSLYSWRTNAKGASLMQIQERDFLNGFVQMTVGNKFRADNGSSVVVDRQYKAFTEDWDVDTHGPDVLYIGLNRAYRFGLEGTGLCWVGISWRDKPCGKRNVLARK